jgi:hypothetical protein
MLLINYTFKNGRPFGRHFLLQVCKEKFKKLYKNGPFEYSTKFDFFDVKVFWSFQKWTKKMSKIEKLEYFTTKNLIV